MKRILILSLSEIKRDPRVYRQINALSGSYDLVVSGYGTTPDGVNKFIAIIKKRSLAEIITNVLLLSFKCYERYYWSNRRMKVALSNLSNENYDLVLANDLETLPLALKVAGEKPVILDAHEYKPLQFEDRWLWRLLFKKYYDYLARTYLQHVRKMFTVAGSIAEEYQHCYGIEALVLSNATDYVEQEPSTVDQQNIRLMHHGGANQSRHLEKMIEMLNYLDQRFSLYLMLINNNPAYLNKLKRMAAFYPQVSIIEPVPMQEIPAFINAYDIGVFLLPPVNFNYQHALPNKLFEFVQGRLAVAIGPSPEMANIVREHGFGVVADSFEPEDLAEKLNALSSDDIMKLKQAAHQAAKGLSSEANRKLLIREVEKAL